MKRILTTLVLVSLFTGLHAQDLKDSIAVLYKNYYELMKTKHQVDSLNTIVDGLEGRYDEFHSILTSNNEKIQKLTDADLFTKQTLINKRRGRIIGTADFINSANVSLNAVTLLDAVTDYLGDIASLNSPSNTDLGFSLSTKITEILNAKIIKGHSKINGGKAEKFLSVVDDIIKSPITNAVSDAIPVVGAIKSVVDLVAATVVRGKDISVNDFSDFKTALTDYFVFYEGLARAGDDLAHQINSIDVRKEALILLIKQYTTERIFILDPTLSRQQLETMDVTAIINRYYMLNDIQYKVDLIISGYGDDYDGILKESKLSYPEYGLSQVKFMRDEIETLGKEYIAAYKSYQSSITQVLESGKSIGNPVLIDQKLNQLDNKLKEVDKSFVRSLNIDQLNQKFNKLIQL